MENHKGNFEDLLLDKAFIRWVKNPDYKLNQYWEEWLKHHQERRQDVILAREVLLRLKFKTTLPSEEVTKKAFNEIIEEIEDNKKNEQQLEQKVPGLTIPSHYYLKVAAVFLILIISLGGVYKLYQQNQLYLLQESKVATITKRNPSSIRSKIKLPDGTKVWLNAASAISYPERFGDIREVQLEGEAYFEVVRDTERPFVIKTALSTIKVLGTSFNVNAYEDDKEDFIALVTGSVKVATIMKENKFVLHPGEQLTVDRASGTAKTGLFDKRDVIGWTEGWLTFKDASKDEIIDKLERWYDVKIRVLNEPVEEWNVNGYFRDQSLELVLDRLSFSKDFQYKIEGRKVTIDFE